MLGKRIMILGDSITNSGEYISVMEYYFMRYLPQEMPEFINLGISSETVSGLSEKEHPFPRPCVLNRLEKALKEIKPDVVIACYGINDGIYQPLSDRNMKAYKEGYQKFMEGVRRFGAIAIVMTPPPFDQDSFADALYEDVDKDVYSYMHPYRRYDEVMEGYANYIRTEMSEMADKTVDIYGSMKADLEKKRRENPSYISGDGIHPKLSGHITIARVLLGELYNRHLPNLEEWVMSENTLFELIHKKGVLMHNAIVERIGHDNPNKLETYAEGVYLQKRKECEEAITEYLKKYPKPKVLES